MIPWYRVPEGHRRRDYEYSGASVRVRCMCRWLSTAASSVDDARRLWVAHIRRVKVRGR